MRTPNLAIPRYDYKRFTWTRDSDTDEFMGSAEASDLGIPVGAGPGQRVWEDACDVGFFIMGERADKLFTLVDVTQEGWVFVSEDQKNRVTVIND